MMNVNFMLVTAVQNDHLREARQNRLARQFDAFRRLKLGKRRPKENKRQHG